MLICNTCATGYHVAAKVKVNNGLEVDMNLEECKKFESLEAKVECLINVIGTLQEEVKEMIGPSGVSDQDGRMYYEGPPGKKGDRGYPGPEGEKGDKGFNGMQGPPGKRGKPGSDAKPQDVADILLSSSEIEKFANVLFNTSITELKGKTLENYLLKTCRRTLQRIRTLEEV